MSQSTPSEGVPDAEPPDDIEPFSPGDLIDALYKPYLVAEIVLGGRERMARNLSKGIGLTLLALLLLLTSIVAPIPYGLLTPIGSFWKIAALYTGSMVICFPCLHIFTQFLGFRIDLFRILGLALVITGVAGLFAFGFAPIIGFIYYSSGPEAIDQHTPDFISLVLLAFSLLMGILHMARCLRDARAMAAKSFPLLWSLWICLLVFITYRMASVLELF